MDKSVKKNDKLKKVEKKVVVWEKTTLIIVSY